jgi:hypothetical protein
MRTLRLACAALAGAALIAACGSSSGQIPVDSASTLHGDLTNVYNNFLIGDCSTASADLATAQVDFDNLLTTVNQKLASQLQHGLSTLAADEHRQCVNSTSTTGPTSTSNTGASSTTGPTGTTGTTGTTSSTSSSSTSSTSSSSTSSSTTAATGTTGATGSTCNPTTGVGGGTAVCDNTTSSSGAGSGLGGAGSGGTGANTGAASIGN